MTKTTAFAVYFFIAALLCCSGGSSKNNPPSNTQNNSSDTPLPEFSPYSPLIADHTIVVRYAYIPQQYIDEVKKMWIQVLGESHSEAYRVGVDLLEAVDSRFQAESQEQGENGNVPLPPTDQYLRLSRFFWNGSFWSVWGSGEAHFWTTQWARDLMKNNITYCNGAGNNPVNAIGFGWCWDMVDTDGLPVSTLDPDLGVHWMGRSYYYDGTDTSHNYGSWGLDEGDSSLTSNPVSMKTYCQAVQEINSASSNTICFYTTGPVDSTGEGGYQVSLKHNYIRNWVNTNGGVLFDYADILCYDDNGTGATASWDGHTYQVITAVNEGDGSIGHISSTGATRLAKAMWWMLARLAGWNGEK